MMNIITPQYNIFVINNMKRYKRQNSLLNKEERVTDTTHLAFISQYVTLND